MKFNKTKSLILTNYLKSGFSTRKLDKILGFNNSLGWKSWNIIKSYGLEKEDKGKLFLYSDRQAKTIIKEIVNLQSREILDNLNTLPPKNLEKYKNTFVLAENEKKFYNILCGETRNIIQDFFNPQKKLIKKCQFKNCSNNGGVETAHYLSDRPKIFITCASKFKEISGNLYKFDVYQTMVCFLRSHSNSKSICFLCKKHHNEFHKLKKNPVLLNKFRKKIIFA